MPLLQLAMLQMLLKIVAAITFVLAVAWLYSEPHKFDGWFAAGVSMLSFLALFVVERKTRNLIEVVREKYAALFQTGISDAELANTNVPPEGMKFVGPHLTDPTRKQVLILNAQVAEEVAKRDQINPDVLKKLTDLLRQHLQEPNHVRERLVQAMPEFRKAIELWEKDNLGTLQLSSVGIALGHAYVKKNLGGQEFAPLSIWIN